MSWTNEAEKSGYLAAQENKRLQEQKTNQARLEIRKRMEKEAAKKNHAQNVIYNCFTYLLRPHLDVLVAQGYIVTSRDGMIQVNSPVTEPYKDRDKYFITEDRGYDGSFDTWVFGRYFDVSHYNLGGVCKITLLPVGFNVLPLDSMSPQNAVEFVQNEIRLVEVKITYPALVKSSFGSRVLPKTIGKLEIASQDEAIEKSQEAQALIAECIKVVAANK